MRSLLGVSAVLTLLLAAQGPARAADDTDKEVRSLLDQAIKAHGGEDKLAKLKAFTVKSKGKVHVVKLDIEFTSTVTLQQPDQSWLEATMDINGQSITYTSGVDGDKGWRRVGNDIQDLDKDAIAEAREQNHYHWATTLVPLKDKAYTLKPLGEAKVEGKDAVGILVTRKDRRDVSLYFDKKTHLLVKGETRMKDVMVDNKEYTVETLYGDYKEFDGTQQATKTKQKRDGELFVEMENTEFQPQEKVDRKTFEKPAKD